MLIINADDWGRTVEETDTALACYEHGRVTSVSAMVFMADSQRAAGIARKYNIDAGLHVNFSQEFDELELPGSLVDDQRRIVRFMRCSRFAVLLYHPLLRECLLRSFQAQWSEFTRRYGSPPSHVDGHQHRHLCANLLIDQFIPPDVRIRRNFTYGRAERNIVNRTYRKLFDAFLSRRYRITEGFFSLGEVLKRGDFRRVIEESREGAVELMVHPVVKSEGDFLLSDTFALMTECTDLRGFAES